MKIIISKFGPIGSAIIEIPKGLMLLTGPNSTGKTYLSYLLYAMLSDNGLTRLPIYDKIMEQCDGNSSVRVTRETVNVVIEQYVKNVISNLDFIFGLSDTVATQMFKDTKIKFELTEEDYAYILSRDVKIAVTFPDREASLEKRGELVTFHNVGKQSDLPCSFLLTRLFKLLIFDKETRAHVFPVERNSIYTFKTELSLSRNALIDTIQDIKGTNKINPLFLLEERSRRYPMAIRDALSVANDIENIQKRTSPFYDFACQLETKLLDGKLTTGKNGDVQFTSNKANKTRRLPIHMTSSIVKTLSSLIFYLKHIACENDTIIIDEPEMNLHPDSQVMLTRFFAELVNAGFRMVVSTHSDFLVREFNNLIMAGSLKDNGVDIEGYSTDQILDYKKVQVNYFNFKTPTAKTSKVTKVEVDKFGFDVQSMDSTIEALNDTASALYYKLNSQADEQH